MQPLLSIIIVNYNGKKFLKDCLDSVYDQLGALPAEVIIIDNDSKDGSCALIKTQYPQVLLIESKINHGFGKGNNEAVKQAKGAYVLLLNNDTILLDPLPPLLDFIREDDSIGVLGINMLNAKKEYMPPGGNFPDVGNMFRFKKIFDNGKAFQTGVFEKESYDIDWLGGSFLLISKKLYDEIGGFDEDFFMYVEDVDFCKRIADKGLRRVFLPQFRYIHFVGFTAAKNKMLIKGLEIYIGKHFSGLPKLFISAALQVNRLVKNLKSAMQPNN